MSICLASYRGSSSLTGAVNNLQGMLYYASYNCPCMSVSCHTDVHEHMHKPNDNGETFHQQRLTSVYTMPIIINCMGDISSFQVALLHKFHENSAIIM